MAVRVLLVLEFRKTMLSGNFDERHLGKASIHRYLQPLLNRASFLHYSLAGVRAGTSLVDIMNFQDYANRKVIR